MSYFIDASYESLNKCGEELCGDNVEIMTLDDAVLIAFSDGLKSGVKANILSTLTTKIGITMLKQGASLEETIETIARTLPVCKVTGLAYSTITFMKIDFDGNVSAAEYDNPPLVLIKNGEIADIKRSERIISGKKIKLSNFKLDKDDIVFAVSDGAINASEGLLLNMNWQLKDVAEYIKRISKYDKSSKEICKDVIDVVKGLYGGNALDDVTCIAIKAIYPSYLNILVGPPEDKSMDEKVVKSFAATSGKKVVCGGTLSNIVSRELNKDIDILYETAQDGIPPISKIDGIDLVTEGILTLQNVNYRLDCFLKNSLDVKKRSIYMGENGAAKLFRMILESTNINIYTGNLENNCYGEGDSPFKKDEKQRTVNELISYLKKLGKIVTIIK
jgi:hypothetical protein